MPLPRGVPAGRALLRLTAYDDLGRVLPDTRFELIPSGTFVARVSQGQAIVSPTRSLLTSETFRIDVKAHSRSHRTHQNFDTRFILFISVSDFPF